MRTFKSTHDLQFLSCVWPTDPEWNLFKIGTCEGQWRSTETSYDILSVINEVNGNGHLQDVFDWFENSCKRDGRALRILEVMNPRFEKHLVSKRGFSYESRENLIKRFKP